MKLALCQTAVRNTVGENIENARGAIRAAKELGADVAVLPEMFCCPYDNAYFYACRQRERGEVWTALSESARENGINVIGGSVPEEDAGRLYNTCFVFDRHGAQVGKHRKLHLFDIDVPGGQYFKESDTFTPGAAPTVVTLDGTRVGVAICFDMRFPELARLLSQAGAEVIVYPAAFNMTTGPAHWELLLRSRALDNQLFVCACSPARNTGASYVAYGHSMMVSPWGAVTGELDEREGILLCETDPAALTRVRSQLPVLASLRADVYPIPGSR